MIVLGIEGIISLAPFFFNHLITLINLDDKYNRYI